MGRRWEGFEAAMEIRKFIVKQITKTDRKLFPCYEEKDVLIQRLRNLLSLEIVDHIILKNFCQQMMEVLSEIICPFTSVLDIIVFNT